jgi:hypothetical protein
MTATMTKNPRTGTGKAAPVTVKRTKPSAPGTIVDTSKAKPVGVVQEAAAKMAQDQAATTAAIKAGKLTKKEQQAAQRDEDAAAASIARDDRDREEAVLSMNDDREAKEKGHIPPKGKAKAAAKKGTTKGTPVARITETWESAKGKDVKVKDRVETSEGVVIDVIGRWTKKAKTGNVPMVTGRIVTGGAMVEKDKGDRHNAVAAEVTHTKK